MMTLSKKNRVFSLLILTAMSTGVSCAGSVSVYPDLFKDEPDPANPKRDNPEQDDDLPKFTTTQTGQSSGGSTISQQNASSSSVGGQGGSGSSSSNVGGGGGTDSVGGAGGDVTSSSTNSSSSSASSSSSSVSSSIASSSSVASSSSTCGGGMVHKWKEQPVIYVSGQSNATGGWFPAAGVYNSQYITTWDPTDEKWKIAKAELGGDYYFGMGSWAGRLSRKLLDMSIVSSSTLKIKNHGWPGMSLSYFLPDSKEPSKRNAALNDYTQARTSWTKSDYEPNVICWAQGEQYALTPKDTYYTGLKSLIDAWHVDYPKVEVIVMVKTAEGACNGNTNSVREVQEQISQEYPEISLINLDDLTKNPKYHDGCHYTLEGYEIMADRILDLLASF